MKPTKEEILKHITYIGISNSFKRKWNITSEECYNIVNPDLPTICKYCNKKELDFISYNKGYKNNCSDCSQLRREETNLRKYGSRNVSGNKEIQKKKNETVLRNYGKTYGELWQDSMYNEDGVNKSQTPEVKKKRKETLIEKYGTDDPLSIKNGRERGIYKCNNDESVKEKRKVTNKEKYGFEYLFQDKKYQEHLKEICIEKHGVDNNSKRPEVIEYIREKAIKYAEIRRNDIDENGLNSYERASIKQKITNEANGNWITEDKIKDFRDYRKLVWRYTNAQPLHLLENIELRGHANQGKYHLDHKYSIFQGFKDNVDASTIGNIHNLEMIIGRNNLSKNKNCSISKEEIIEIQRLINE